MKRKHKSSEISDGDTEIENNTKVLKVDESSQSLNDKSRKGDFDIKQFRKDLGAAKNDGIVLNQFLQVCLNPDNKIDYMLEYLEIGGNAHEILRQITNKKNLATAAPPLHLFQLLLVKVQSLIPHLIPITEEASRYFLNNFQPTIEMMISEHSSAKHKRIILKLLASMVTLNHELGIEILNQFKIDPKNMGYLATKSTAGESDNVRSTLIQFVISFTIDGNMLLLKALLEKHGLLSLIIPGLTNDDGETVITILNILKTIIENPTISKTLKLHTFNHNVIQDLFKLFYWNGPKNIAKSTQTEYRTMISDTLHALMLTVCTSSKVGVYFADTALGTGETQKNQNIYKALQALKRPWENKKHSDLVLNIVRACPEFAKCVLYAIEQVYNPKNAVELRQTNAFLITVLRMLKPKEVLPSMKSFTTLQIFNFIKMTTMPVGILKHITAAFDSDDLSMLNEFFIVLFTVLSSLRSYLHAFDTNFTVITYLRSRLDIFIPRHFPPIEKLIKLLNEMLDSDSTSKTRSLINLTNLLKTYLEIQPQLLENVSDSINTMKLLDIVTDLKDDYVFELKIKVVSLMIFVDKHALSVEKPLFKRILLIILQVYTNSTTEIHTESKNLLRDMFLKTNLFNESRIEIDILLYSLKRFSDDSEETVINCISETIENVCSNMDKYKEMLLSTINTDNINDVEITDCEINDIFTKLESAQIDDKTTTINHNTNLSIFIVGILKYLKKHKTMRKSVNSWFRTYFVHLLHAQESPALLTSLINGFKIDDSLKAYVESWSVQPQSLNELSLCPESIVNELSRLYTSDDNNVIDVQTIFSAIGDEQTTTEEVITWVNITLFHAINETNLQTITAEKSCKYITVLDFILASVRSDYVRMYTAQRLLSCATFIRLFTPYSKKPKMTEKITTDFIVHFIEYFNTNNGLELALLKPFQSKLDLKLSTQIERSAKKGKAIVNADLINVLKVIPLRDETYLSIVSNLVDLDKSCFIYDDTASAWLDILSLLLAKFSRKNEPVFSVDIIEKAIKLYRTLLEDSHSFKLLTYEQSLYDIFKSFPIYVKNVDVATFQSILKTTSPNATTIRLGAFLLKRDTKFVDSFEGCLNSEMLSKRELILPLAHAYTNHRCAKSQTLETIYREYKSTLTKIIEKPHKIGRIYVDNKAFVLDLVHVCITVEDSIKITVKDHKFEIADSFHIELVQAVALKALLNVVDCVVQYFLTLFNFAGIALKNANALETMATVNASLTTLVSFCSARKDLTIGGGCNYERVINSAVWHNYSKYVLRYSLKLQKQSEFPTEDELCIENIGVMTKLVRILYPKNDDCILPLYEMVTSHSEFLNVMLSYHSEGVKSKLLEFLLLATIKNKSVMKSTHIPVFLSSYHATMSSSDRLILAILHQYESNGQPMHEYQPYLWGDSAASYYSVRRKKSSTLWSRPTPNQVLNLLEKEKMDATVRFFPIHLKMNYVYELPDKMCASKFVHSDTPIRTIIDRLVDDRILPSSAIDQSDVSYMNAIQADLKTHDYGRFVRDLREMPITGRSLMQQQGNEMVYDPTFILPLASHIISPESVVSCFKIMRSGVISVCVMALSSDCPSIRAAAYYVLSKFYALLEVDTKHKNDKFILTQFIDTLKLSLSSLMKKTVDDSHVQNPRLPAISALYLARALSVITAPFDPLYKPVNNFLIARNNIDFTIVPDLLSLLHDCAMEYTQRRHWILEIMRDGLRTAMDANICFKSMSFKMILDLHSSVVSDRKMKRLILEVLQASLAVPKITEILINGHGVVSFLSGVFKKLTKFESDTVHLCINIVETMWYSLTTNSIHESLSRVYLNVMNKQTAAERVRVLHNVSIRKDTEFTLFSLLLDLLPLVSVMPAETFAHYVTTMKKFTKQAQKLLSKQMLLILVNSNKLINKDGHKEMLTRAVEMKNTDMLKSLTNKVSDADIQDDEKRCLLALVDFCLCWL